MNVSHRRSPWRWAAAVALIAGLVAGAFALRGSHVDVAPEPPSSSAAPLTLPATTSFLSIAVTCPDSAIAAQLENAIPKSFPFDVRNGERVYGSPSRGPIKVENDVGAKRVVVSTPVGGRVQVEKKIAFINASVGIDISGGISASFSPVVGKDWTINPQLGLSAHLDRAVAKTAVGDIDITGHVQGAVNNAVNGVKGPAEAKLASALNVRKDVERLWNEINSVHKLADDPPTWLRITPKQATFGQFKYSQTAIDSGLALVLETHVFVQEDAPERLSAPLPDLSIAGALSDDFDVSLPIEVSYDVINGQLKAQLSKETIELPEINASVAITGATIQPYGDGILLALDFNGKRGFLESVSGRLYVTGIPVFDADNDELRVDKIAYTAATESLLLKSVEWLAHSKFLDTMKAAAVVKLGDELDKARDKANGQLGKLKGELPKEVGANVSVAEVRIDRLAFARARAFAVVKAKGKMSAQLKP